jgi:ribosomal protein L17
MKRILPILMLISFPISHASAQQSTGTSPQAVQPASYVGAKATTPKAATAIEFQVRTDIYVDESQPPKSSLQTLFTNGLYIELDDLAAITTVVDPSKGRVTLMDNSKKSLVHLDMKQIETQLQKAFELLTPDQLATISSSGEVHQESSNLFAITNQKNTVRYVYQPIASRPEYSYCYGDFANWSCRVTALYYIKMPPQLRLHLNELLMEQSQLPAVVKRSTQTGNGKTEELTARLILTESLSNSDRAKVASVYQNMQQYKHLPESAFFASR